MQKAKISLFDFLTTPLVKIKAKKIRNHCAPFLGRKTIDIGAGRCLIAREIQDSGISRITCLDVVDVNATKMRLIVYNGKKIPFPKNSFDTALIAYVLHHCDKPEAVLAEAARVCRGNIVIFEDTDMNSWKKMVDTLVNKLNHEDINTPLNFRTKRQWLAIFRKLRLKLVRVEENVEREWWYPGISHTMFVVRK